MTTDNSPWGEKNATRTERKNINNSERKEQITSDFKKRQRKLE